MRFAPPPTVALRSALAQGPSFTSPTYPDGGAKLLPEGPRHQPHGAGALLLGVAMLPLLLLVRLRQQAHEVRPQLPVPHRLHAQAGGHPAHAADQAAQRQSACAVA